MSPDPKDYRDTPEWTDLEVAVGNLLNRLNQMAEEEPGTAADFELTVFEMPNDPGSDVLGGYIHFATSRHAHTNQGLVRQAERYWDNYACERP